MHHIYLSYQSDATAFRKERDELEAWCKKEGVEYTIITEYLPDRASQRQIDKLLRIVGPGDIVVATKLTRLGRGMKMLMMVLRSIYAKGADVICIDNGPLSPSVLKAIEYVQDIDREIRRERSVESLLKAAEQGRRFGRPVGKKKAPEKNVLYGKTELLEKLIAEGVSKSEIARRLDVSRGTIVNYLAAKQGL